MTVTITANCYNSQTTLAYLALAVLRFKYESMLAEIHLYEGFNLSYDIQ